VSGCWAITALGRPHQLYAFMGVWGNGGLESMRGAIGVHGVALMLGWPEDTHFAAIMEGVALDDINPQGI